MCASFFPNDMHTHVLALFFCLNCLPLSTDLPHFDPTRIYGTWTREQCKQDIKEKYGCTEEIAEEYARDFTPMSREDMKHCFVSKCGMFGERAEIELVEGTWVERDVSGCRLEVPKTTREDTEAWLTQRGYPQRSRCERLKHCQV